MTNEPPGRPSQPRRESGSKTGWPLLFCLPAQLLLIGCAALVGVWSRLPRLALVGILLAGLAAIIGGIAGTRKRKALGKWAAVVSAASALLFAAAFLLPGSSIGTVDNLFAAAAWMIGGTILLAPPLTNQSSKNPGSESERATNPPPGLRWKQIALAWSVLGEAIWLVASYLQNQVVAFHLGLLINIGLLLAFQRWFRLPMILIQIVNTLILLSIGLPVVDFFLRPSSHLDERPETRKHFYSYDTAKKDPVAFSRWWKYYNNEWDKLKERVAMRDPTGVVPYRLRPGSSGDFFQSHFTINSNGFRGKEISAEKGDTFRIVAIGESTTFGVTMNADDKPWPELLEAMIRTRLKPARRVEVVNAGIPAHTLIHTLSRLQSEILPLKPDMVICYHGFNGLYLLNESLPHVTGPSPPKYQPRPLKLLADAEQSLKMSRFRKNFVAATRQTPARAIDPMTSPYADAYRQLIQATRTNHIRLAIATFSMAVNPKSDSGVMEFYRTGFPAVRWQVQANVLHALMVRQLVMENPDVDLVDTQPKLDGCHEKFIDLMHLTQEGRQEVAEAFYAAIENTLQKCLATPTTDAAGSRLH